jgi:UDP-4-amino-4,6-dideoxy-N-acetyl-beta-L-altrosamine transaminase
MIPYGRQDITQEDVDAVVTVLRSDFLTQGPVVPRFEAALSERVGARHGVAVNSATSALHIACMAVDLGPGDLLWTVPNTFVASANCARYCGADVDFVDIDIRTWNIDLTSLEAKLADARKGGRLPKVVVPVHFSGQPTEQERIWDLAREYGFRVIEDASHSVGASRNGEPVGSCRWSDLTVFSFHPVKIITSGEGGMVMTNDGDLAERLRLARSHGITRDPARLRNAPATAGAWYYEQLSLGYNYRLTDIHAALGLSQISRLEANVRRRNEIAQAYDQAFASLGITTPLVSEGNCSAFHLYVVRTSDDGTGAHRRMLFESLRRAGLGVNVHYMPVHLQPYYRSLGFHEGQFPNSEAYGRTAITLPLFAGMTVSEQDEVIRIVRDICR